MSEEKDVRIVHVPMLDTGLGREAGYKDDAELIEAAKAQRAEIDALLTPEAQRMIEDAERAFERRILGA